MATKHTSSCLQKAADNEPVFVLRAQDALAPVIVRYWAVMAKEHGLSKEKYDEAMLTALEMEKWPGRKLPD